MRLVLLSLSAMLTAAAVAQPPKPSTIETAVSAAVENFQPLWSPPKGQLRGWVVGINPAGADLSQVRGPLCDDLSLTTAAHLYHLVRRAGGRPVLTRADGTTVAHARRAGTVARARCDLCVSIRYVETGAEVSVRVGPADPRPNDVLLAEALGTALGVEPAERDQRNAADTRFIQILRQTDGARDIAVCDVLFACSPETSTMGSALRMTCFEHARGLYEGISQFCAETVARSSSSAKPAPAADTLSSQSSGRLMRLTRSIWPEGRLPDERIDWFCRKYVQESITNQSLVYFDVSPHLKDGSVVLRGHTNVPMLTAGLVRALRAVGFEQVSEHVQALPDREHLGEHLFGVCRVPMALTHQQPEGDGRPQTQLLFGEPLFLLDLEGESYLLHAGDGYWGWAHRDAVQPMTSEQFDAYVRRPRDAVVRDIDKDRVRIPRGSNVRLQRASKDERVVLLPDGSTLSVPVAAVTLRDSEDAQAAARVRAALDLLYVPYVFGGRSPLGLDCSGLTSNVWSRVGVTIARDARQQALAAQLVATRWHRANIRPGDQLFLINESGKIYHTGIALDAVHVIHSAPPCVQIGSFDPQDPLYDVELDRNFFMVKRP